MRPLAKRIHWEKIGCILCAALTVGAVGYGQYRDVTGTRLVEYRKTIEEGDTLWSICGKIATNKEDMGRLVWQTTRDNHIADPGNLQPGQEIVIRVKEARKL